MIAAMAEWEGVARVRFQPRVSEADYLLIQPDPQENWSESIGRLGGPQVIKISSWSSKFLMCHELCHALGFYHEQQRPDRDKFIEINWGEVRPGEKYNFEIRGSTTYGPYDFDSIMHYGQFVHSQHGKATISVLSPNQSWQSKIGQLGYLSRGDIQRMAAVYGGFH